MSTATVRPGVANRRSGRISRQVPILLIGNDAEGTTFCEETHTVVLSLHGAGIVSRHPLIAEQELVLRIFGTDREAEIRVIGEIAVEGDLHTYGVAFLDENLDFWRVEFPPAPQWQERPEVLTLQCSGCQESREIRNGEFEYDVCMIHGGLPRFCDLCGYLTVWRRTSENGPPRQPKDHPPAVGKTSARELGPSWSAAPVQRQTQAPLTSAYSGQWSPDALRELVTTRERNDSSHSPVIAKSRHPAANLRVAVNAGSCDLVTEHSGQTGTDVILPLAEAPVENRERRDRVRAKVSFFACVRTDAFGDDVVKCIDMSKGGVSFKTQHRYSKEMRIEIAVPYAADAKDSATIFVRGRIANVVLMEPEGMWRCGVEFLR